MSFRDFYLVRISGIETDASIGIHGFEQAARQRLMVSVTLMVQPAGGADDIGAVVDYDFVREGGAGHDRNPAFQPAGGPLR
jgi:dihydroneopterin aldolase